MAKDIDKLGLVLVENRSTLVTRSKGKDVWYTPGGKREAGETDKEALIREIKEELTVDIMPETIEYFDTFKAQAHGKPDGTMVQITCYTARYQGVLKAGMEIAELAWFKTKDKQKASITEQMIIDCLFNKDLID